MGELGAVGSLDAVQRNRGGLGYNSSIPRCCIEATGLSTQFSIGSVITVLFSLNYITVRISYADLAVVQAVGLALVGHARATHSLLALAKVVQ